VRKPKLIEGDWVRILSTKERGVIGSANEDTVVVVVPRSDDWPFPKRIHTSQENVARAQPPRKPKPDNNFEEALL
jgi:hypothetical protein